jgi:hypothetical protein
MTGSDHPYVWDQDPVDTIMRARSLNNKEKMAVLSRNAALVLRLKA